MIRYHRQFKWAMEMMDKEQRRYECDMASLWCAHRMRPRRLVNKRRAFGLMHKRKPLPRDWKRVLLYGGKL